MKKVFTILISLFLFSHIAVIGNNLAWRGVVYDVGLRYNTLSVDSLDYKKVDYEMEVISNILKCNTVRIEGESLSRLADVSRIAHRHGLKIFFNPWKMGADEKENIDYMTKAATIAEQLLEEGLDMVFVAGCEYSLFCKGVFPGESFDERLQWFLSLSRNPDAMKIMKQKNAILNGIMSKICKAIRSRFSGKITYSSGTWEDINWTEFDIIGIDYYRNGESDKQYLEGLNRYKGEKPLVVMEVGCCAYKGAYQRGSFGFGVLKGSDADGNLIYEGGTPPVRSEKEQARYVADQINLINRGGANGVFIFVFKFPIYPYRDNGADFDMTSYALVKSFAPDDPRYSIFPGWSPKLAFYQLGISYSELADEEAAHESYH